MTKTSTPTLLIAGLLTSIAAGTAMLPSIAAAQVFQDGASHQMSAHQPRPTHVEGHIAFLKAELKITPEQESLFATVAAAIRTDVQDLETSHQQMIAAAPAQPTAVQLLERRTNLARLRVGAEERFLNAFRPLYASLSPDQKQTADELIAQRGLN